MGKNVVNIHKLSNGLTLVTEERQDVSSAAFVFMLPAGAARDPEKRSGTASVLSELLFRGTKTMDNRTLNTALDSLGLHRNSSVSSLHNILSGSLVADNLPKALEIYRDIICNPALPEEHFPLCQALALQSLESLEDDPRQKISLLLREQFLPTPFGRPAPGKPEHIAELKLGEVQTFWKTNFVPNGAVLAVAGKIDTADILKQVESLFGSWTGDAPTEIKPTDCKTGYHHENNQGAQVHVGVMYKSLHVTQPDYYKALLAVNILSGGMGSRLFTEVREKRGLCYAVGASHQVIGPFGAVQCYVGSSPEKAQESLDVMVGELKKLADGITENELDRAKVGLRASLIMHGESTTARAMACASDYYQLGRVRSLEEIEKAISSLSVDDVLNHVKANKPDSFMVTTLGPKSLDVSKL